MAITPTSQAQRSAFFSLGVLQGSSRCLDLSTRITQNPPAGPAFCGPGVLHQLAETFVLSDRLSLNIWCPVTYHARLEAVMAPFEQGIDANIRTFDISSDDLSQFAADANEPSLIMFSGLADVLAEHLSPPTPESKEPEGQVDSLPTSIPEVVDLWTEQSRQILAALRRSRKHITLVPASALLGPIEALQKALAARYGQVIDADFVPEPVSDEHPEGQPLHFALMANSILQTATAPAAMQDKLNSACLKFVGLDPLNQPSPDAMLQLLTDADRLHWQDREDMRKSHERDMRRVELQAETTIQRLRHQIDSARLEVLQRDTLSNRLSENASQNEAASDYLKEELVRREASFAGQHAELKALRNSGQKADTIQDVLKSRVDRQEKDIAILSRNLQMRDQRIQSLAAALHGHEDEVTALRRSTSWRVTAPLRGFTTVLRKILRRG